MAKTETELIDFKINTGTYTNILNNINSIGENELIITDDKNIPIPTAADNGKVVGIVNGDFSFVEQSGGAGGGTTVVANPTLIGTETQLTSIGIESINYKIPQAAFHYFEEVVGE